MGVRRYRSLPCPAVACVLLAACAGDGAGGAAQAGRPLVVATTTVWADVVDNVACAGSVQVEPIVPAGGDPHSFEPSLRDRELLADASLVVANGAGLEPSLDDALAAVAREGVEVFTVADEAALIDGDPHVWMDPVRVGAVLPALADALAGAGLDRATVQVCSAAYAAELAAADAEVAAMLATIPKQQRRLVTSHDSLAYFADRHDFAVIGAVIPGGSTLGESNPAELQELAAAIDAAGVRAIFAEEQHSAEDVEALATELGDVTVATLFTDGLGPPGSGAETYLGLLRTNGRLVAEALAP